MKGRVLPGAILVALLGSAACTDALLAPPNTLSATDPVAVLNCTGSASGVSCAADALPAGVSGDVIYGGFGSLVRLTAFGTATYSGGSNGTLSQEVRIQNLLGMPLSAASDWVTQDTTGVKVFMHVAPNNGVTFTSADGTGTYTGSNQQYVKYDEIIAGNGGNQTKKIWTFVLPTASTTFTFQVYIYTRLPNEVGGVAANVPAHTLTALGTGSGVGQHMCAIRSGGSAYCWGNGQAFEFGIGPINTTPATETGIYVAQYPRPVQALSPLTYTAIAAGAAHTCGIVSGGTVRCWGTNAGGRLGDNTTTARNTPVAVSGLTGATGISLGTTQSCAMTSAGAAFCWGGGTLGELGNGGSTSKSTPQQVTGLTSGVTAISAGGLFACAVVSGSAKCWGYRSEGRIGDGDTVGTASPPGPGSQLTPTTPTGLTSGVTDIAAGAAFGCAVVSGGVKCWGANSAGQIGNGTSSSTTKVLNPTDVNTLGAGSGVVQVVAGNLHACALMTGGTVKCWGGNSAGQLGINSTSTTTSVVDVTGLSGVDRIAASNNTTCAHISATNKVKCWGSNNEGMIGDGTTATLRTTATDVLMP